MDPITPPAEPDEADQAASDVIKIMEEQVLALELERDDLRTQLGDVLNWILANFEGRYPLKETSLSHLNLPPMDEAFGLHPDLAEFLNVTADEQFMLEDAFNFTRGSLRVLQEKHMTISTPTPAQVTMTIAGFPDEGQVLREDLYAALEASLGTDRLDRLRTVSEKTLSSAFDYFGQASRTLMFEIVLDEADNQMKVVVNDGWFDEQNPDQLVYSENESTVSALPAQYEDFQIYLPETFDPFMQVQ